MKKEAIFTRKRSRYLRKWYYTLNEMSNLREMVFFLSLVIHISKAEKKFPQKYWVELLSLISFLELLANDWFLVIQGVWVIYRKITELNKIWKLKN